jgi:hypothetical protein
MCSGCNSVLAQQMAKKFYDIPIAVTVLFDPAGAKVYGAYIGDWKPYELPAYSPLVATLAIEMGLFNDSTPGEINGEPVTWWRNKR